MIVEQYYFEDVEVGETYDAPSQTLTDAHFLQFAGLVGDFNPIHMDQTYAEETQHGDRVAHGMLLTAFTVVGASRLSPHLHDSMIAFLNQSSSFNTPAFVGDTVFPELEVIGKESKGDTGVVTLESRVHNQDDDLLLTGELEILLATRGDESE